MNIPYNNGKVSIGSRYDENQLKPKYVEQDWDMLEIQKWLIGNPEKLRFQYWCNVAYYFLLIFVLIVVILRH